MSLFNEKLKQITLKEMLSLFIILFIIHYLLNSLNIVQIGIVWIYIFIIFYFVFKLKDVIPNAKKDISDVFSPDTIKLILFVVILNIFLSYGMLYFSNFVLGVVQSKNIFNSFLTGGLIATIIVSPISEELIFRGVFLNRLQLALPTTFAVLISSLLFASLHSFGSIFAAFIFGVCVAVLYLKTENIFVPILAHFLNNLFAEIIVRIDYGNILFTNSSVILIVSILAIISLVLISFSIIKEFKYYNK